MSRRPVDRTGPALVVLGEGGHTAELLALVADLSSERPLHYVLTDEDVLSAGRITRPGPIHRLPRPRAKDARPLTAVVRTLRAFGASLRLAWRVRPAAVLTTGPAIGVPVAVACRLLGAEIVFVETISRITALSGTGRIMRRVADLYLVQWPGLAGQLPRARYEGRLL